MALSLFRKYRPETFADVVGQQHIEQTLSRAIANDQTAAAYLFCGPRGTGKTSTARLLAKGLLCEHPQDGEPDDSCPQCREISLGIHPDVYELDAASRTGVDNVREEIISRVAFAPTRGRYKIYIIDEVHMLSTAAFNALLKTLEEPPPHIRFVLCTTDAHRVPDTIQSRCQRFDFHRLGTAELVGRLQHICDAEGFKADDEALALIAAHARGGMRDAIVSLEQIAVFGDGTVSEDAATSLLGNVPADQLRSLAALIAARDIAACFVWIAEFSQKGTDIAQFARSLTRHLRDIYVLILLSDSGSANASGLFSQEGEELASLQGQAAGFSSSEHLAYCLQVMTDLNQQLKTDADPRLALELALVRMADPRGEQSVAALSVRLADLEKRLESSDAVLVPIASAIPQSLPHSAPVAARPAAPANPPGQAATAAAPPAAPPGQAATAAAPPAAPAAATAAAPPAAPPGQAATAAAPPTATAAAPPAAPPGQAATAAAPPAAPAAAPPAAPAAAPAALGATPLLHDDNDACRLWQ
ncbi:MAG: DNA polymerase III subunit gamma/tau, partial [Actinomycetia bacterium]|nr:DNA polymerase III subunit gamma/tau [Actinomycetes bacterium]